MTRDLDLDLLRGFLAVVDTGGFTKAARHLNRVQSAVSTQVRKLEEITGTVLLERGRGRSVGLTDAGETLAGHARRMLALNDEALARFGRGGVSGAVRIGTTDTYAYNYLPRVLSLYAQNNPRVELEVHCKSSRLLLRALDRGEIDFALVTRQPERHDGDIVRRESLVWAMARGYRIDQQDPLPLAFMPRGCAFRAAGLAALDGAGLAWRLAFRSEGPAGVLAGVRAGMAMTVLPRSTLDGGLMVADADSNLPQLGTIDIAVHRRAGAESPAAAKLIDAIIADLSALPSGNEA
ncbi:MAG: LysR family transcriptional regulator [Alphaproteobacteria bacterium]|nr:LysR family transcriptional regulator [Alphaproteobacteria bacterium]